MYWQLKVIGLMSNNQDEKNFVEQKRQIKYATGKF